MSSGLPIDILRAEVETAIRDGAVVITSPTGSGKSTQVPRWLAVDGPVLVVEPRRIACRSLAARVADLEGARLGDTVGYSVRDEHRAGPQTRILFATPGVVLRMLAGGASGTPAPKGPRASMGGSLLAGFRTIIVDELHERRLDTDLILALLCDRWGGQLAAMSATLDGDRVAAHLGGRHLRAEGRLHPVEHRYQPGESTLPSARDLEAQVVRAIDATASQPGDVLVFLPGKAEIAACAQALSGRSDLEILPLHGGLDLAEQARVFAPAARRRGVLATNVAETSLTLPGVGVVVDSGLVRQTRYHDGRGFLSRVPIARDSADQRAGRAGRTAPGVCVRLWSPRALLEPVTPPEIHRESLVPLLLAAAACDARVESRSFLDPPRPCAVAAAAEELRALGALDSQGQPTPRGRRLFGLPLDAHQGRLLVEAEHTGALEDAIDLVAVLATGRRLLAGGPAEDAAPDEPGCDATALIRAVRDGHGPGLSRPVLREARANRQRLRHAFGLAERADPARPVDRARLARTALQADPRCGHIPRRHGRRTGWSNGGTELELSRDSAVDETRAEALVVLDTHAAGVGHQRTRLLCTCAMPIPARWLVEAGLGEDRLAGTSIQRGRVIARVERIFAGRALAVREEIPQGALARSALRDLLLRGTLFREAVETTRSRLQSAALLRRLDAHGATDALHRESIPPEYGEQIPELGDWLAARLDALGVESGDDLALLTPGDVTAPALPDTVQAALDREFPRTLDHGDAAYAVEYDPGRRMVTLRRVRGRRKEAPRASYLPAFAGFSVRMEHGGAFVSIR